MIAERLGKAVTLGVGSTPAAPAVPAFDPIATLRERFDVAFAPQQDNMALRLGLNDAAFDAWKALGSPDTPPPSDPLHRFISSLDGYDMRRTEERLQLLRSQLGIPNAGVGGRPEPVNWEGYNPPAPTTVAGAPTGPAAQIAGRTEELAARAAALMEQAAASAR